MDDDHDGLVDINDQDCNCVEMQNLILNGDFESFVFNLETQSVDFPTSPGQIQRAQHWINPTNAYDIENAPADSYYRDTFNLLGDSPFPSGNGAAGIEHQMQRIVNTLDGFTTTELIYYKEFLGTNLNEPLIPGKTYVFSAYVLRDNWNNNLPWPHLNFAVWGSENLTQSYRIAYGTCPSLEDGYSKLLSIRYYPENHWIKISGEFIAERAFQGFILGIDCGIPTMYYQLNGSKIIGIDQVAINEKSADFAITVSGPSCMDSNLLTAVNSSDFNPTSYQWYFDGIAIPGETSPRLQLQQDSPEGFYAVRAENSSSCRNSSGYSNFKPEFKLAYDLLIDDKNNQVKMIVHWNPDGYIFSVDGENFTANPIFSQIPLGENFIYVRNRDGCILKKIPFAIFQIYNVITPNNDGLNDFWKINGIQYYVGSVIQIFDRYGVEKFNHRITENQSDFAWDGKVNGAILPSGDYWYQIHVSDGRKINGKLTLKLHK